MRARDGKVAWAPAWRRALFPLLIASFVLSADGAERPSDGLEAVRVELRGEESALQGVDDEIRRTRNEAEAVAAELAVFDRAPSLGPVQRAQYSRQKQRSETLAGELTSLQRRRASIMARRRDAAERLVELLDPAISEARAAYVAAPRESEEQLILFTRYEALVREHQGLHEILSPTPRLIQLDVDMDADDTADSLQTKADILADVVASYDDLAQVARTWRDGLVAEREIVSEARRLREENDFFRSVDPLDPSRAFQGREVVRPISVPPSLEWARDRLVLPEREIPDIGDLDRLVASISELNDEILGRTSRLQEKRRIMQAEAERRRGLE
jgi:hypothetical protein